MVKRTKFVYDADGVPFTIYRSDKPTKSGHKTYWLLEDFSTGKRRTLNNVSKEAAERRADQIRAAMVKGQAHRLLLSNGQWQDVCMAKAPLPAPRTASRRPLHLRRNLRDEITPKNHRPSAPEDGLPGAAAVASAKD